MSHDVQPTSPAATATPIVPLPQADEHNPTWSAQGGQVVVLPTGDKADQKHGGQTASSAKDAASSARVVGTPAWQPFPVGALPEPVGRYVQEAADSIGCDRAFVALPLLSVLAGAVGTSTRIQLKPDWQEPAVVWTGIVGDSGTHKSPALNKATSFLGEQDAHEIRAFQDAIAAHEIEQKQYEANLKTWQRKPNGFPPIEPQAPVCRRYVVSDVTVEALVPFPVHELRVSTH